MHNVQISPGPSPHSLKGPPLRCSAELIYYLMRSILLCRTRDCKEQCIACVKYQAQSVLKQSFFSLFPSACFIVVIFFFFLFQKINASLHLLTFVFSYFGLKLIKGKMWILLVLHNIACKAGCAVCILQIWYMIPEKTENHFLHFCKTSSSSS